MSESVNAEKEYIPWILGRECPAHSGGDVVIVIPESYCLRVRVDIPVAVLLHEEALLYAIEGTVPSIKGRGAILLHAESSTVTGHTSATILIYPEEAIKTAVNKMKERVGNVVGAVTASEWWGITLPPETALWVDDGVDAWVRLSSGEVYSVNSCLSTHGEEVLWIHERPGVIKGVVCYSADPVMMESLIKNSAWPDSVRWRVLPLEALYEAPRNHVECLDLLTRKNWSERFSRGYWSQLWVKRAGISGVVLTLITLGMIAFPWVWNAHIQSNQRALLKSMWMDQYPGTKAPQRIEAAWDDSVGRLPLYNQGLPHFDPLGMWSHINRTAVWLSLPELLNVKYEGQRWWLSWATVLPLSQQKIFKDALYASGWHVDVSEDDGHTRMVISSSWVE